DSAVATDDTDSDANPASGETAPFTLVAGQSDTTRDAGLFQTVTVGDVVFFDVDSNGSQGPGEPGIPGVKVFLDSAGVDGLFGTADDLAGLASQVTDASGGYLFTGQAPGTYRVRIDPTTLPNGLTVPTFDLDGLSTPNQAQVTLSSGQDNRNVDFGYQA